MASFFHGQWTKQWNSFLTNVFIFAFLEECFEELRLLHLKLFLEDCPKNTTDDSISNQFAWNNQITDQHIALTSFLTTIVGTDFRTQRKTFEAILAKCDDWLEQCWKTILLLLRIVIDNDACRKFNDEQLYELKTRAKSMFTSFLLYIHSLNFMSSIFVEMTQRSFFFYPFNRVLPKYIPTSRRR